MKIRDIYRWTDNVQTNIIYGNHSPLSKQRLWNKFRNDPDEIKAYKCPCMRSKSIKLLVCRPLLEQKGKLQHSSEGEARLLQSRRKIIKSRSDLTKMYKETQQCLSVPFVFLLCSLKQLDRYGQLILTNSTAADTGEYSCWLQQCNGNKCRKDETKTGSTYIFFTGN